MGSLLTRASRERGWHAAGPARVTYSGKYLTKHTGRSALESSGYGVHAFVLHSQSEAYVQVNQCASSTKKSKQAPR